MLENALQSFVLRGFLRWLLLWSLAKFFMIRCLVFWWERAELVAPLERQNSGSNTVARNVRLTMKKPN